MQRTNRASRSRLAGLLTGAAVAAAVGATGAIIFAGDPVGAAPSTHKTVTITFTDAGPSPSAVQLSSGDAVTFVNHLTQSGQLPVGNLLAQVQSAGVTVQNAATGAIKLPNLNDSKTLTYTGPLAVKYTATYTMSLLPLLNILGVNLLPSTTTSTKAGTIDVAAAPQVAPAQQNPGSGLASKGDHRLKVPPRGAP